MTKIFKLRAIKRFRNEISDFFEFDLFILISKPSRRIRTNQLTNQTKTRVVAEKDVKKFHKRLTDRWFCNDERCINSTHEKD